MWKCIHPLDQHLMAMLYIAVACVCNGLMCAAAIYWKPWAPRHGQLTRRVFLVSNTEDGSCSRPSKQGNFFCLGCLGRHVSRALAWGCLVV